MRAAGFLPIITVVEPIAIESGGPTHTHRSPTAAAGSFAISTVGHPARQSARPHGESAAPPASPSGTDENRRVGQRGACWFSWARSLGTEGASLQGKSRKNKHKSQTDDAAEIAHSTDFEFDAKARTPPRRRSLRIFRNKLHSLAGSRPATSRHARFRRRPLTRPSTGAPRPRAGSPREGDSRRARQCAPGSCRATQARGVCPRQPARGRAGQARSPTARIPLQRKAAPRDEPVHRLAHGPEEDETHQLKADPSAARAPAKSTPPPTAPACPMRSKPGSSTLSGLSMDHVKVHYNSAQPAQLNALAYAQGGEFTSPPARRSIFHTKLGTSSSRRRGG